MKRPRISLSDTAANDILEQADWYEEQANARLAKRWERAVSQALLRVVKNPFQERHADSNRLSCAVSGAYPSQVFLDT